MSKAIFKMEQMKRAKINTIEGEFPIELEKPNQLAYYIFYSLSFFTITFIPFFQTFSSF